MSSRKSVLNPMVNIWSLLCHKVHANNKQFLSANFLFFLQYIIIVKECHNISESELEHLVTSMKNSVWSYKEKRRTNIVLFFILDKRSSNLFTVY